MSTARPAAISIPGLMLEAAPVNNGAVEVVTAELPAGGGATELLDVGTGAGVVSGTGIVSGAGVVSGATDLNT